MTGLRQNPRNIPTGAYGGGPHPTGLILRAYKFKGRLTTVWIEIQGRRKKKAVLLPRWAWEKIGRAAGWNLRKARR
jgi:hypothetical protein